MVSGRRLAFFDSGLSVGKEETSNRNQPEQQRIWTIAEAQSQLCELLRLAAEEGPQHSGADRPFVVVPAGRWYAREQPRGLSHQQDRIPMGKWLVENMPRGIDLELPSRREVDVFNPRESL
ncbi:MAG: hypothetical protein OXI52_11460 [Caldilineaceae bacterium]|nr:hypothetical protein [Caldilineaceae bacterium]